MLIYRPLNLDNDTVRRDDVTGSVSDGNFNVVSMHDPMLGKPWREHQWANANPRREVDVNEHLKKSANQWREYRGPSDQHDMAIGPCKCGAWHSLDDIIYFKDGDQWCATFMDFTSLQESLSGWGKTPSEATGKLWAARYATECRDGQ